MSSDPKKSNNPAITWDGQKETIDWHHPSVERKTLGWMLIELICTNDERYWDESGKGVGQPNYGMGKPMEVVCTIDGVPVRLSHLVERLVDDYERQVKIEAADKIKDKFQKIEDIFSRLSRSIKDEFPELIWNPEDDY